MATMLSTLPRTRWTLAAPAATSATLDEAASEARRSRGKAPLSEAGRVLLTAHFVRQLHTKLDNQREVLALLESSPSWALEKLYKEFHSVRAAATLLQQFNMASVAARGEVLVQLLKHKLVDYEEHHYELLDDTVHILQGILDRIERDGSDLRCFSTARTALCLYAAAEPKTQYYEASHLPSGRP